jgi:putative inorganic carbon (HCO3(-)) transporter
MFMRRNRERPLSYSSQRVSFNLTEWLLTTFVLMSLLATIYSVNFRLSIWGLAGEYGGLIPLIAYGILFLWVSRNIDLHHHRQVTISLVLGSVIPTIYGILQHFNGIPGIQYLSRSTSFFCNADFYGTYLALVMVLTLALYTSERGLRSLGYLVLFLLQFVAITFSSTRSAWLGGLIGVLIFGFMALSRHRNLWKKILIVVCAVTAGFVFINLQSHNQVATRAASIASNAQQVVTNHDSNYAGSSRWYIWKESLSIISSHPWLGTGPDTFEQVFQPPHAGAVKYLDGQLIANANNAYLQIAVTLGLPALIALLAFYLRILFSAWSQRKRAGSKESYLVSIGLFATALGYLVQAFFNMDVVMVAPIFWVILGMLHRTSNGQ